MEPHNKIKNLNNFDFFIWNDKMATKYNPELYHKESFLPIRFFERFKMLCVLKLLEVGNAERILDLGCGAGNLTEYFSKSKLFGIDLCRKLLIIASKKKYAVPLRLVQGFGESLPFKKDSFDKIYCLEVIEHCRDPLQILKEANRVLKINGHCVLTIPNEDFIIFLKFLLRRFFLYKILSSFNPSKYSLDMNGEWHLHKLSLRRIKELIKEFFLIEKVKFIPSFFFPVRIILLCRKKHC